MDIPVFIEPVANKSATGPAAESSRGRPRMARCRTRPCGSSSHLAARVTAGVCLAPVPAPVADKQWLRSARLYGNGYRASSGVVPG